MTCSMPPPLASPGPQQPQTTIGWIGSYPVAALLLTGLGVLLMPWDCAITRFVQEHPLRGDLRRLINLSEAFGYGLSALFIVVTAMALDRRGWPVGWRLASTTFGSGLASNIIKGLIARQRPSTADLSADAWTTFQGWLPIATRSSEWGYSLQSFPSSHTATAVGLAAGLAVLYPRGRWLFLFFAIGAGLQRVASNAHFVSDCLFGAALAWLVSGVLIQTRWFRAIG